MFHYKKIESGIVMKCDKCDYLLRNEIYLHMQCNNRNCFDLGKVVCKDCILRMTPSAKVNISVPLCPTPPLTLPPLSAPGGLLSIQVQTQEVIQFLPNKIYEPLVWVYSDDQLTC